MTEPELTISTCEVPGHDGHAARIAIADRTSTATFCLRPEHAGFLSQALARFAPPTGELAALRAAQAGLRKLAKDGNLEARDMLASTTEIELMLAEASFAMDATEPDGPAPS